MSILKKLFGKKTKEDEFIEQRLKEMKENVEENKSLQEMYKNQADRNLKGIEFEKEGKIDKAIEVYEKNVKDGFDGNHPYDRLAIIYRRKKFYDEEIRVLNRAIEVFEKLDKSSPRQDVSPKLQRFKDRLKKAKKLEEKHDK